MIDYEDINLNFYRRRYPRMVFITLSDNECREAGFQNVNFLIKKPITSWEKALYYFSTIKPGTVWFVEDDVFLPSEKTLLDIDRRYPNADLLSNEISPKTKEEWHWRMISIASEIPMPYYYGMMCACRMSTKLLSRIKEYARKHGTLFFLEAMFPTLCKTYDMVHEAPEELSTIKFRYYFPRSEIRSTQLYHPVKNFKRQMQLRDHLFLLKKKDSNIPKKNVSFLKK